MKQLLEQLNGLPANRLKLAILSALYQGEIDHKELVILWMLKGYKLSTLNNILDELEES